MKKILILSVLIANIKLAAQKDYKLSVALEGHFMEVTSNLNIKRLGLNGSLAADYKLNENMYAGAYLLEMTDISKRTNAVFLINGKIVDLSTSSFTNFGIYGGYRLYTEENFSILPELRLGYGMFRAQSVIIGVPNSDDLTANMLTFVPRVLASYRISKCFSAGLSVGYPLFIYTSDQELDQYNMQNTNIGTFLKVSF